MSMTDEDLARVDLIIVGRVQGVFFRSSILKYAQNHGISGWVKNLADSSVEVVAEGPRFALSELLSFCRRGPPEAEVQDVIARFGKHQDEFRTFRIIA